ncbi:hypothetical protein CASFOL_040632 [Castilleja foliolosa]|uniref:Uncharacterized protein n=1 Tax=Castilleja foliolosa TaxID=1961234 RepID=A0ABD3BD25_9LAMI
MAVIGDLAPKFGGMMKKDTNFNSNKGVFFGIPISSQKFRTSESRFAVKSIQSVMQVGLEKKKEILTNPNSSKGLLGFDVVSESELREKGFMGMRKTKLVCTWALLAARSTTWRNWLYEG